MNRTTQSDSGMYPPHTDMNTLRSLETLRQRGRTPPPIVEPRYTQITLLGDVDHRQLTSVIEDLTNWLPFDLDSTHCGYSTEAAREIVGIRFLYLGSAREQERHQKILRNLFSEYFELKPASFEASTVRET